MAISILFATPAVSAGDAEPAWSLSLAYKADVAGVVRGGIKRGVRALDNLDVTLEADLEQLAGWHGAHLYVDGLNNLGGRPNDLAGTLQGVNNIEVADTHAKLYQAWIEQQAGDHVSILAGLYDLNSEFYHNESAGLLIAPPFGIGSELSATGPNGPSIFPSTALSARVRVTTKRGYAQVAVINAHAGTVGDVGGVDLSAKDGALLIGEVGWTGSGKIALGAWRYTKQQPRIVAPGLTAAPPPHRAQGAYLLLEHDLVGSEDKPRFVHGFVRVGLSDGKTTPFSGGWQAGILVDRPIAARPESAFSIGFADGALSSNYRMPVADAGGLPPHERMVEITYSDRLMEHVSLQPDLQYFFRPAGDSGVRNVLVLGLRLQVDLKIH
jgi:porin